MEFWPHVAILPIVAMFDLFATVHSIILAQASGTAGSNFFATNGWLAWVIVAAIGAAAGATELIAKYRDEPSRALTTGPALLYTAVNAAASLIALFIIRELNWDFGVNADQVNLVQIVVAGFGAMIILRAAVFTIRAPGQEAMVGPVNVLQTILEACDRAVDRRRASARAAEVSALMKGISFEEAVRELPVVCLALMQSLSSEEQYRLRKGVDALRTSDLSNEGKCLSLGLVLLRSLGEEALKAAITTVKERIKLAESMVPVIEFAHPLSIPAKTIEEEADIPLFLSGRNFDVTSRVLLNGDLLKTNFDPMSQRLLATLPMDVVKTSPEHTVTVFTRTNGGGESAPVVLRLEGVNAIPDLVAIDPSQISFETVAAGGDFEMTLIGSDFVGESMALVNGQEQETTFVNGQELKARVKMEVVPEPGTYRVTVVNPEPMGGVSPAPQSFVVLKPGEPDVGAPPPDPAHAHASPNGAEDLATPDGQEDPQASEVAPAEPLTEKNIEIVTLTDTPAAGEATGETGEPSPTEPEVNTPPTT